MNAHASPHATGSELSMLAALLGCILLVPPAMAAVDRPASIEASGEGAIFDVKATAAGTLRVGTMAGRSGDRLRVTIVQASAAGAVSAVGSGSQTNFSGYVSRQVVANVQYIVLVTWDRPLPGTLPTSFTVRFTGPTDTTNPPVTQLNGGSLATIAARPIRLTESNGTCPADGSPISCGDLLACTFDPAGDTDSFTVTVPADSDLSINISGPVASRWRVYAPNGAPVNSSGCSGRCQVALPTAGSYTVETYNTGNYSGPYQLSLLGVSTPFRCGPIVMPPSPVAPFSGQFTLNGDTNSYLLNGVLAGQTYSVNCTGPVATRWQLFDPTGNPVNASGCSGLCQVTLPSAGNYTLEVYNTGNYTGSYTCSLQRVGG